MTAKNEKSKKETFSRKPSSKLMTNQSKNGISLTFDHCVENTQGIIKFAVFIDSALENREIYANVL